MRSLSVDDLVQTGDATAENKTAIKLLYIKLIRMDFRCRRTHHR